MSVYFFCVYTLSNGKTLAVASESMAEVIICVHETSSSHGGEYDVQSCLLGYTATYQLPENT
jgi:hypothetical protein